MALRAPRSVVILPAQWRIETIRFLSAGWAKMGTPAGVPMSSPFHEHDLLLSRRQFFGRSGIRLGSLGLACLAGHDWLGAAPSTPGGSVHPPLPGLPHFPAKAKAV